MKKLCILLILCWAAIAQARITAEITPNPVKQGDAVELILSSDTAFSGVPNIEILKKDFVIGGQQRRQSAQWVNGKGQSVHQLIYTLFPNKSGTITIQGLKVDNENIAPLTLSVRSDAKYETKGNLTVTVECPKNAIYPSQKLLCQVYLDDGIGLTDGQIIPPQTDNGTWEQVLPPLPTASSKSGVNRYQSAFAFTPKKSGTLKMDPFIFQGEARVDMGSRQYNSIIDFMFMNLTSHATRPVATQSQPFDLLIKEKPANYKGWWLPSPRVTLTESYQLPDNISVGEPISRTLTLSARDVLADNMPVPEAPSTDGLKVYANPAQRMDNVDGGQVTVTMTFVPTRGGEVTLPAIQVPWFNSTKETIETAIVPERKIFIPKDATTTPIVPPIIKNDVKTASEPTIQSEPTTLPTQTPAQIPWVWIILALAGAFLLGIVVTFLVLRKHHAIEKKKKKTLPDLYPF
ncbi:MAG: BatD family protein [Alphaproteobacteria bacterium]|nr:BatD family protein [Alphaproteobacteria bacterium]